MSTCGHPVLTEVVPKSATALDIEMIGEPGNVTGMFMWKKYECEQCHKLITILQAVVEG